VACPGAGWPVPGDRQLRGAVGDLPDQPCAARVHTSCGSMTAALVAFGAIAAASGAAQYWRPSWTRTAVASAVVAVAALHFVQLRGRARVPVGRRHWDKRRPADPQAVALLKPGNTGTQEPAWPSRPAKALARRPRTWTSRCTTAYVAICVADSRVRFSAPQIGGHNRRVGRQGHEQRPVMRKTGSLRQKLMAISQSRWRVHARDAADELWRRLRRYMSSSAKRIACSGSPDPPSSAMPTLA